MFRIRLRLLSDSGARRRVLADHGVTWTTSQSASSAVRFSLSSEVADALASPFLVGVEVSHGSEFVAPKRNLHIAFKQDGDDADPSGMVQYEAIEFVPWLMARMYVRGFDSLDGRVVKWDAPHSASWIMSKLITQAKLKPNGEPGGGWGPGVTTDSDGVVDSWGQTWAPEDWSQIEWSVGKPLSSVAEQLSSQGFMEWWTEDQLFRTQRSGTGRELLDVVVGGPGFSRAPYATTFEDTVTNLMIIRDGAPMHIVNEGADNRFGELWAVMTQSGVSDTDAVTRGAQPALADGRSVKQQLSFEWSPTDLHPLRDFEIGDVITARTRGGKLPRRVVGFVMTSNAAGVVTCRVVVGDKILTGDARRAALAAKATVGKIIGGSGDGVPGSGPLVGEAPAAPTGVVFTSAGEWRADGTAGATTTVSWSQVLATVSGTAASVGWYEVWERLPSQTSALFTATDQVEFVTDQWAPSVVRLVKVRAQSRSGVWSDFSAELAVSPAYPVSVVPKPPQDLTIVSNTAAFAAGGRSVAQVTLEWDAVTQSTDDLPLMVAAYRAEVEDGQEWVPLSEVLSPRQATITVLSGVARRVRVRARTALGVWGDPSTPLEVTGAQPEAITVPPTAPTLTTGGGGVFIRWDGLLTSGAPPSGFQAVYAEYRIDLEDAFVRVAGPLAVGAGQVAQVRPAVGDTVQARLVLVDTLGRVGATSAAVSIVTEGYDGQDIIAGTISVDKVQPAFGQNLDLESNGAVNILITSQQATGAGLAQAQSDIITAQTAAEAATASAATASTAAANAQGQVAAVSTAQAATQAQLAQVSTYYRFGADGAIIGRSDSVYQLWLANTGAQIRENGVVVSEWNAGQMIVPSLVTQTVVLSAHQVEQVGARTVFRAITT